MRKIPAKLPRVRTSVGSVLAASLRTSMRTSLCIVSGAVIIPVLVSACSTVPEYDVPGIAVPAHFGGVNGWTGWTSADPADTIARGAWWEAFGDSELDRLEAKLRVSNQSIQKALADLDQARAAVTYQKAGFYPTVSASVTYDPSRTSASLEGKSLAGYTVPDHSLGLTASWEPDVFGRIRASVAVAQADQQASQSDLAAVKLAMHTQLALDYFQLRSLEQQGVIVNRALKAYTDAYKAQKSALEQGAIDASVVAQAQAQMDATRTQAIDLQNQRAIMLHAIATLVGQPASGFSIPEQVPDTPDAMTATTPTATHLPVIPPSLPSQLLQRRPDIAAAERRVNAANAQIGVARTAYFPSVELAATAGLQSTFLSPWLTAPSLFWSLGPQLIGTLFDGGKRAALMTTAHAQYASAVADYRQTVLQAFQSVEDSLSSGQSLQEEKRSQDSATAASQVALRLMTNRYNAGAVSFLDLITTRTIALSNEQLDAQIAGRQLAASVMLIESVGGTW